MSKKPILNPDYRPLDLEGYVAYCRNLYRKHTGDREALAAELYLEGWVLGYRIAYREFLAALTWSRPAFGWDQRRSKYQKQPHHRKKSVGLDEENRRLRNKRRRNSTNHRWGSLKKNLKKATHRAIRAKNRELLQKEKWEELRNWETNRSISRLENPYKYW